MFSIYDLSIPFVFRFLLNKTELIGHNLRSPQLRQHPVVGKLIDTAMIAELNRFFRRV